MTRTVIFPFGYDGDIESLSRGIREDILIQDDHGNYYNPEFIVVERIDYAVKCNAMYLAENVVILNEVTKETIFSCLPKLYKWGFYNYWKPLSQWQVEKHFYPMENWEYFDIDIE